LQRIAPVAKMAAVERDETRLLQELRDPQLPRAVQGYEEDATRNLLDLVAAAYGRVAQERDRLLQSAGEESTGGDNEEPGAAAIGQALATAAALGDRMVSEAKEQAKALRTEAEAEAARVLAAVREEAAALERELRAERAGLEGELDELRRGLERERQALASERNEILSAAHREADEQLAQARAEIVRVNDETGELKSFLETATNDFVSIARQALERLDDLEAADGTPTEAGHGLVPDQPPSAPPPQPAPSATADATPAER
jgi:cell division septum initiation protein DivIVA